MPGVSPSTISRELRRNTATAAAPWSIEPRRHSGMLTGAKRPKTAKLLAPWSALTGPAFQGRPCGGSTAVTGGARTGGGRRRGAPSRSPTGSASVSPMISRCGSRTRRSTSRSTCRAVARCSTNSPPACSAAGRSGSPEPASVDVARASSTNRSDQRTSRRSRGQGDTRPLGGDLILGATAPPLERWSSAAPETPLRPGSRA